MKCGEIMDSKCTADIWYLDNSGFAVKTSDHFLIFDYFNDRPIQKKQGLDGGIILPSSLKDQNVLVFASHSHSDHFTSSILKWNSEIPKLHYVLSHDIRSARHIENVTVAYSNNLYEIGSVRVRTLKSTDRGVAYLVFVDGLIIYHAGDLNWWHWEGEPDKDNEEMAASYKKQIDLIKGERIDIAFVPVDPRLEDQYLWGLDYFMHRTDTAMVFPMHFMEGYSIFDRLEQDPVAIDYKDKITRINHRGERFAYYLEAEK